MTLKCNTLHLHAEGLFCSQQKEMTELQKSLTKLKDSGRWLEKLLNKDEQQQGQ